MTEFTCILMCYEEIKLMMTQNCLNTWSTKNRRKVYVCIDSMFGLAVVWRKFTTQTYNEKNRWHDVCLRVCWWIHITMIRVPTNVWREATTIDTQKLLNLKRMITATMNFKSKHQRSQQQQTSAHTVITYTWTGFTLYKYSFRTEPHHW